jgi:hypothetical protein
MYMYDAMSIIFALADTSQNFFGSFSDMTNDEDSTLEAAPGGWSKSG